MLEKIVADYGFYMGWSFGMMAILMIIEWFYISICHQKIIKAIARQSSQSRQQPDDKTTT